jgi:hypothetical protein
MIELRSRVLTDPYSKVPTILIIGKTGENKLQKRRLYKA